MLICKAAVRRLLKENEVRASKEIYEALNFEIKEFIVHAAQRAKGNNRRTIFVDDL